MSQWFQEFGFDRISNSLPLWLGSCPADLEDITSLEAEEINAVVSLCQPCEYQDNQLEEVTARYRELGWQTFSLQVEDFSSFSAEQIDTVVSAVRDLLKDNKRVYLHCRAGWQRSASIACLVLALENNIGLDEALWQIQMARPEAQPMHHQWQDISCWLRNARA
jgi:atypical dual specificity phosphatase